ncbi:hypothetical protein DPX16_20185 [Anabarilius grahami]|uniref:Uncharacterized protein n=1 Tax=Anabarilius grahami TaxID=495550 RepID=A0A3N0XE35_ANAGA|nr:hypothetical protein DPX16_20185 [Anabarilius grahami]
MTRRLGAETGQRLENMEDLGDTLETGYKCGCISKTSEHCRMNPLQSSAEPEKGASRAMGLANTDGEEAVLRNAEVLAGGAGVGVLVRVRRSALTKSWNGSGLLIVVAQRCRSGLLLRYTGGRRHRFNDDSILEQRQQKDTHERLENMEDLGDTLETGKESVSLGSGEPDCPAGTFAAGYTMDAWERWRVVCLAALSVEDIEDIYLFGTMITGLLLIGLGFALVYRENRKTVTAVQNLTRLPVMIETVGRAVSTETGTINRNMDNIMEKLTALQRQLDRFGDQNGLRE